MDVLDSYGNRQTIASLLRKLKQQSRDKMKSRKPEMIASLRNLGDFVVDLKWDFTSWLPLVSRILPSDICKISKKGASIRLDTTLVDFSEMRWERGDITFLYRCDHYSRRFFCAHLFVQKANVNLIFDSPSPRFDKCHENVKSNHVD